jgi:hypothetical protein
MSTTAIATRAGTSGLGGYRLALALLVFLWALATALTLFLLVICFVPGHAGFGEALQRLSEALPLDPRAWSGFAP